MDYWGNTTTSGLPRTTARTGGGTAGLSETQAASGYSGQSSQPSDLGVRVSNVSIQPSHNTHSTEGYAPRPVGKGGTLRGVGVAGAPRAEVGPGRHRNSSQSRTIFFSRSPQERGESL